MMFIALLGIVMATGTHDDQLEQLTKLMVGSFSSQKQAKADADYFDVRLEMVRIWPERSDGHWLYVEQAMASTLEKPYRQRIYQVTREAEGSFKSAIYILPGDPLMYAGAWKHVAKIAQLKKEALTEKKGCQIVLSRQQDGSFVGSTTGKGCSSELRGASYATSKVKVTSQGLETWDQGYDAGDKQVWGAVKGPYQFMRVTEAK